MKFFGFLFCVALISWSLPSWSIGPRAVTNGHAVKWSSMPVTVHVETDLTVRGKDVSPLVDEALATWTDLSDSNVTFVEDSLGVAIDEDSICDVFVDSSCGNVSSNSLLTNGENPLIIDEDGEITALFFGASNKFTTLGFASILGNFNATTGAAVKGQAVFNAACLGGTDSAFAGCTALGLSFSDDDFVSFMVHELGHFLGLDHSQVNLDEANDNDSSNDDKITTMFPLFIVDNGANFKTPERDDQVALAQLYPSASFTSSTWTISGIVYDNNGSAELQCANVVARNTSNPKDDAISAFSGDFAEVSSDDGSFTIPGLTAGASYTLDVEPIDPDNAGGASGYTPCRGSNGEPDPPGTDEITAMTSSLSFTGSAGDSVEVTCVAGNDCEVGDGSSSNLLTSSSGGCSLIPH